MGRAMARARATDRGRAMGGAPPRWTSNIYIYKSSSNNVRVQVGALEWTSRGQIGAAYSWEVDLAGFENY